MLLDEGPNDFLMQFDGAGKANRLPGQALDAGSQGEVVALDTLGEDFSGQVFLCRDFPRIAPPIITGDEPYLEGREQGQ